MGNQQGKERRSYGRKIDWENAEKPSPPGKPYLVPDVDERESDFITIRWAPPVSDGGAPILGYVVEHRRTGSPHWLRAIPYLATETKLTLTGLEPGWRYQFRVSAENDIGRSTPGEISEVLTVTSQRTAATAPHFNVELQDTIALENEKVEFTVHVVAIPQAKISWYKDGFEVFSSRRMKIVTENDQSTFIIHQAALEDEGEIKCAATNRAGHSVTKAILKLEAPPRIRLPRQYEDGLLFEKGELVRLKVTTAGRPPPQVTWYHDGELIRSSDRFEITDSEGSSSLRISEARREDRGEYQIKGSNKIGEDFVSFLVTVTDRPLPPGKPKVVMALGRSVTLSWTSPDDDGGCKIGNYIVEYYRVGWNMWLKAVTCRQLTAVLSDLIEGSEYKFRVKAENPYGMSDPSEESDVIFIPDPKRGILTPPEKKDSKEPELWQNGIHEEMASAQEDFDSKHEKRRILENNARRLLDKPLPALLSGESTAIKPPRRIGSVSPTNSTEGVKRSHEDSENIPPPVPKRRHKADKQKTTPSLDNVLEGDDAKDSPGNAKELSTSKTYPAQGPREKDHTMFYGSSELMLVLLPEDSSKSAELSEKQRTEVEMNLIGPGIAPPISISAPELGSEEPVEFPSLREAVSSSELLHERAMSRLYQDAMDEEAQKMLKRRFSSDRKSVERRPSLREGSLVERRHSFKDNVRLDFDKIAEEVSQTQPKSKIPVKIRHESEDTPSEDQNLKHRSRLEKPVLEKDRSERRMERMSSVEREEMEFAAVRERIRLKNEQNLQRQQRDLSPVPKQRQHGSKIITTSSEVGSCELDNRMDVEDIEEEGEEDEEEEEGEGEEEEEEDYLEEEEEETNEEDDGLGGEKSFARKFRPPAPKRSPSKEETAPFAEEEDDSALTMTSRIVLPRLEITLPPVIEVAEEKSHSPKPLEVEVGTEEPTEVDLASEIPVKKREKRTTRILKKLGLKKEKKIPEIIVEMDTSAPGSPLLKPILKNKQKKKDKESRKADAAKDQLQQSREAGIDDAFSRKKKQVRISEPNEDGTTVSAEPDEEEQANKVLIYHYSDIVREFGYGKKPPPKQYLNCEDLKAVVAEGELTRSITSLASTGSNAEERGSSVNMSDVDNISVASSANVEPVLEEETKEPEKETKVVPVTAPSAPTELRSTLDYFTDVAMFLIACWLYFFKDELYAVPVLCVMVYRQLSNAFKERYQSMRESFSKRFSKRKDEIG